MFTNSGQHIMATMAIKVLIALLVKTFNFPPFRGGWVVHRVWSSVMKIIGLQRVFFCMPHFPIFLRVEGLLWNIFGERVRWKVPPTTVIQRCWGSPQAAPGEEISWGVAVTTYGTHFESGLITLCTHSDVWINSLVLLNILFNSPPKGCNLLIFFDFSSFPKYALELFLCAKKMHKKLCVKWHPCEVLKVQKKKKVRAFSDWCF